MRSKGRWKNSAATAHVEPVENPRQEPMVGNTKYKFSSNKVHNCYFCLFDTCTKVMRNKIDDGSPVVSLGLPSYLWDKRLISY